MTDVAMALSYVDENGSTKTLILENIEDVPVNESSSITKHPIPTGEYVSDTMYKEPITMEVTGMFSLAGKKGLVISDSGDLTLENIQDIFRTIKNQGILCDLVKIKVSDNNLPLFSVKRSMALQSIRWTEKINSLGFTFSFQQVMQVEIQEYDVDPSDGNLPDVEDPKTLNFTETFLDTDKIVALITQICKDNKIVGEEFLQVLASYGKAALCGLIAGLTAVLAAVIIAGVTSGGVLLMVGAVVAIAVGWAKFISDMVAQSKAKVHIFRKHILSQKKTDEEVKRWGNMCQDIVKEFEVLNDKIMVYQVSSNKAHQAILSIDDEYYCFTFTRNNTDNHYALTILDLEGNIASDSKDVSNIYSGALRSIDDCNATTSLLNTTSGYQAFLMNPNEERTDDLTECFILVSSIDMTEYNNLVYNIIKSYLLY